VSSTTTHDAGLPAGGATSRRRLRPGDVILQGIALAAAVGAAGLLGLLAYKVIAQAWPAIRHFGLGFLWTDAWNPNSALFGAASFIFGTIVTSFIALLIATPISIAIALFLTEIAPKRLATPIATVIELLAAIPSVVLGLWGILVLGPFMLNHLEPGLQSAFGFLPIFSGPTSQAGVLPAALILTIMIVPIVTALCREILSRVPRDLTDGSLALGSTRWEAIRRVALPFAAPGLSAAMLLGLGRAFGEAIAVTQVIGSQTGIHASLFHPGDTLGSKIAATYQGADTQLQLNSLLYLGAILMVISLLTNVTAQSIVSRFEKARRLA
jgi:phosphate transport system permease protein